MAIPTYVHLLLLPAELWLGAALVGAIKIASDEHLTGENIREHIQKCVVEGKCPLGDSPIHRLAERVTWTVIGPWPKLTIPMAIFWLVPTSMLDFVTFLSWHWTCHWASKILWFDPGDVADWCQEKFVRR